MTRRLVVVATAVLLVPLVGEANAAGQGADTIVETIPPTPNLPIVYGGITYSTDRHGVALLPPQLIGRPRVPPTTFSAGRRAVFQRWYGRSVRLRAALDIYYRVRLRYVDLRGRLVDPDTVDSIQIRSSIGERSHPASRILWLRGTRVVPLNGGLESKPIYYTIERVVVGGSNVVNESQQKFFPARQHGVTVQLLFYRARFRSRDAFFGFPVGDRVRLTFPRGSTRRYRLGGDGTVVIPSLPRGSYHVEVEGGGISLGGPVALSRDQDVKVGVVSYLDLGAAAAPLAAVARLPRKVANIVLAERRAERSRVRGGSVLDPAAGSGIGERVEPSAMTSATVRGREHFVEPAQMREVAAGSRRRDCGSNDGERPCTPEHGDACAARRTPRRRAGDRPEHPGL